MMSPGHAQQMDILLALIGLLLFVIIGVVVASQLKRKKTATKEVPATAPALEVLEKGPATQAFEAKKSEPELAPIIEKDVELKEALRKTEENLFGRIRQLFKSSEENNSHLDEIEEILYTSDLGPTTVQRLMGALETKLPKKERADYEIVRNTLKEEIKHIFLASHSASPVQGILSKISFAENGPTVLMIVGVNGAGKTTSIGKISAQLAQQGKKVLVAAGTRSVRRQVAN